MIDHKINCINTNLNKVLPIIYKNMFQIHFDAIQIHTKKNLQSPAVLDKEILKKPMNVFPFLFCLISYVKLLLFLRTLLGTLFLFQTGVDFVFLCIAEVVLKGSVVVVWEGGLLSKIKAS